MAVVIDSSMAACWALPDEYSEAANRALDRIAVEEMIVPGVFPYEIRNVLVVSERRGRIGPGRTEQALRRIAALGPAVDPGFDGAALLDLARRHCLTAYDASYLELALRSGSDLGTLDRRLADAATAEGVSLVA